MRQPSSIHIKTLFPTRDSLHECLEDLKRDVGEDISRRVYPYLMTYHNTLIHQLENLNGPLTFH